MAPPFLHCESHPGRLLTDHLLDVANRAGNPGEPLWLAGLYHDLGKATGFFQDYLHGVKTDVFLKAHALFGAFWLFEALTAGKPAPGVVLQATLHALFVRGHHGRLGNLEDTFSLDHTELERCRQRLARVDSNGIVGWLSAQLGRESVTVPSFQIKPLQRVHLSRALDGETNPAAIWSRFQTSLRNFGRLIGADRDSASQRTHDLSSLKARLTAGHLEKFRAAGRFGSTTTESSIASARDAVFHAAIAGGAAQSAGGQLWTLEVPTGAGKTLAALGWATARRHARRSVGQEGGTIFYALPFTSIIDQTAVVLRRLWPEAVEEVGTLAIHHHLADYGAANNGEDGSLARDWAETWQADVVCTTFVQIIHALFHGTAADARRFAALADGGILILDEAQALPAELWPTLRAALLSLVANFGVDVLLLTATQPALLLTEDSVVDLRPRGEANLGVAFDRYDIVIEAGSPWDAATLVAAAVEVLNSEIKVAARSALLLLNTVNEALAVYGAIRQHPALKALPIFHLSTNLRPKDRARILEEIRTLEAGDSPRLLVATQVVEAGVDLSFDVVFRAHAPLDAIVQAAGRCNRHGSGRRGTVRVFAFSGASGHRVYGPIKMGIAGELLNELSAMFPNQPVPEPAFVTRVPEFFRRVRDRLGSASNKARAVTEAVRRLEFAALRGENDSHDAARSKQVELIAEDASKVPVFIETDFEDEAVWQRLVDAHALSEPRQRRAALRALRAEVGACVVSVPERPTPPAPDATVGLVHIHQADFSSFYDHDTGWKRPLFDLP